MLDRFTLIAGPCVLEDDGLNVEIGRQLAWLSSKVGIPVVFKASFDKANRSRAESPRGPGLERRPRSHCVGQRSSRAGRPGERDYQSETTADTAAIWEYGGYSQVKRRIRQYYTHVY